MDALGYLENGWCVRESSMISSEDELLGGELVFVEFPLHVPRFFTALFLKMIGRG